MLKLTLYWTLIPGILAYLLLRLLYICLIHVHPLAYLLLRSSLYSSWHIGNLHLLIQVNWQCCWLLLLFHRLLLQILLCTRFLRAKQRRKINNSSILPTCRLTGGRKRRLMGEGSLLSEGSYILGWRESNASHKSLFLFLVPIIIKVVGNTSECIALFPEALFQAPVIQSTVFEDKA